jgi:hypothetical protein
VKTLFTIAFLSIAILGLSQTKWDKSREMGLIAGTSYYIGDINPTKHFGTRLSLAAGMMYRNNISKKIGVKGSFMYGRVEAYDMDAKDPWQVNRNLSFRNDVLEVAVTGEINYFDYQIGDRANPISPYLFLGLAYYSMRPQAEYLGNWYELQPLGTEGQGTTEGALKYKTSGISMPFGAGLKVNLFSILAFNVEWGMRRTWTDYFDDVSGAYVSPAVLEEENGQLSALLADRSTFQEGANDQNAGLQRGDPGRKDWYNFTTITLSIRLGKSPTSCWK